MAQAPSRRRKPTAEIDALWTELLAVKSRLLRLSIQERDARAGVGIASPSLDYESEAAGDVFWNVYQRIQALPDTLEVIAAKVLLETNIEGAYYWTGDNMPVTVVALTALRPLISGAVAITVADYLDHLDRPLCYGPLWGSYGEPGQM